MKNLFKPFAIFTLSLTSATLLPSQSLAQLAIDTQGNFSAPQLLGVAPYSGKTTDRNLVGYVGVSKNEKGEPKIDFARAVRRSRIGQEPGLSPRVSTEEAVNVHSINFEVFGPSLNNSPVHLAVTQKDGDGRKQYKLDRNYTNGIAAFFKAINAKSGGSPETTPVLLKTSGKPGTNGEEDTSDHSFGLLFKDEEGKVKVKPVISLDAVGVLMAKHMANPNDSLSEDLKAVLGKFGINEEDIRMMSKLFVSTDPKESTSELANTATDSAASSALEI